MGLGIDKFKELWGVWTLEVVSYSIVVLGAVGVGWVGWKVSTRCTTSERAWILIALVAYGIGTFVARSPQERLHYLGYGMLAILLHPWIRVWSWQKQKKINAGVGIRGLFGWLIHWTPRRIAANHLATALL